MTQFEAKEPIVTEGIVRDIWGLQGIRDYSTMFLSFPQVSSSINPTFDAGGCVWLPILSEEQRKAFEGKEVTITIALKGGEV